MEKKKMTYEEFLEIHKERNRKWKFDLFSIVCKKCGSEEVEFNSDMESDLGYYNSIEISGEIVIKCHKCGNAFKLTWDDLGKW